MIGNVVRNIARRGLLKAATVAGGGLQLLRVTLGEVDQEVGHAQPYGLESVPLPGAEVYLVAPNGAPSLATAVAVTDRRNRSKDLLPGEAALHNPTGSTRVAARLGGVLELKAGTALVTFAPGALSLQDGVGDSVTVTPLLTELRSALASVSLTPAGIVATAFGNSVAISAAGVDIVSSGSARLNGHQIAVV